jgi:NAD(P)-dependent dehydrogenase (short-subunit alcohol dehydrogenase family)
MTYQHYDTLVIVFGAGGRLGRALLPILAAGPWVVVAVARKEKPLDLPLAVHWIQVDVTEVDLWERSLRAFCGMAEIHDRVIIVDLLLDKASVTTMCRSLAAGTAYIVRLRSRLAAVSRPSSLVLASTTAVLAPWLYQTPYGLAKRRQLRRYASAGMAGQALLLPQLVNGESGPQTTPDRFVWTYAYAAALVLRAVAAERRAEPARLRLIIPRVDRPLCRGAVAHRSLWLRAALQVLELHIAIWTSQRDSPLAHRLASRGRLELTPAWLRRRIDHHLVPAHLVRLLGQQLRAEVEEQL